MNAKKIAINLHTDWYKPTFTNRAAAQKIVLPCTIHRFVVRTEQRDLQHLTLHSVGATSRSRYFFVVRTEHSDLRHLTLHSVGATSQLRYFFVVRTEHSDLQQGIRQYKNSKKSKNNKQFKGYGFSFFSHSKKQIKTAHKTRQELKPVQNTKGYCYAEIRHKTVTFLYGRNIR